MQSERARHIRRCLGVPFAISILFAGTAAFVALPAIGVAQQAPARVVQGKVQLGDGTPVKGAIVYLKNAKTLEVRTYISTDDGNFRFGQLNSDASYTVWAEYQGRKSKEKGVSSFDNKKIVDLTLKIEG
jgi:hypothetical protein